MLNCEKCWDNPCTCGHQWEQAELSDLIHIRSVIDKVIAKKEGRTRPSKRTPTKASEG